MITHTVIVRLQRPLDAVHTAHVLQQLRDFAAAAPHADGPGVVHEALVLRADGPSSAEGSLVARFADEAAFQAYLADPLHLALVADVLRPNCESWLSIQSID